MRVLLTACATTALVVSGPLAATAAGQAPQSPVGGAQLTTEPTVVADGATPPAVQASAFLVADLDTGAVLAAKAPHAKLRPASTLKTLTALVLLPRLNKADQVVGTDAGRRHRGQQGRDLPRLQVHGRSALPGHVPGVRERCRARPGLPRPGRRSRDDHPDEQAGLPDRCTRHARDRPDRPRCRRAVLVGVRPGAVRPGGSGARRLRAVRVDEVHELSVGEEARAPIRSPTRTTCCSTTPAHSA